MIEILIPLLSLIALEVILGIDNIIFISILADKLPENQRNKLRFWGISLAMVMRLCLLAFKIRPNLIHAVRYSFFRERADFDLGRTVSSL